MEEQEFEFGLERKYTVWERGEFTVTATSREEAIMKAKQMVESGEADEAICNAWGYTTISGTYEELSPEDNGNQPTQELRDMQADDVIWANT